MYEELNLSSDDYTLFMEINAKHRREFQDRYAEQLEQIHRPGGGA